MKEILAYSNSARPSKAEVGQLFINVRTGETFVFKEDKWHPIEPVVPQVAQVLTTTPENTPSTPEQVLCEECKVEVEEPAPVAEEPKPKKKSTSKKTKKVEK